MIAACLDRPMTQRLTPCCITITHCCFIYCGPIAPFARLPFPTIRPAGVYLRFSQVVAIGQKDFPLACFEWTVCHVLGHKTPGAILSCPSLASIARCGSWNTPD